MVITFTLDFNSEASHRLKLSVLYSCQFISSVHKSPKSTYFTHQVQLIKNHEAFTKHRLIFNEVLCFVLNTDLSHLLFNGTFIPNPLFSPRKNSWVLTIKSVRLHRSWYLLYQIVMKVRFQEAIQLFKYWEDTCYHECCSTLQQG